ncbi:MAG TPA: hypothetical protein VMB50_04670 [Myxococcales bacterium]|nr:hypothetical protein [Myxococcales bacterium]
MISGAHTILYSKSPEADRAFLRDILKLSHVDVGDGWLIFGLPPSEIAVHPAEENGRHELYLLCDDVNAFTSAMGERGIQSGPIQDQGWGLLTEIVMPGGGKLGVYEPRHARPKATRSATKPRVARAKAKAKPAAKRAKARRPAAKRRPVKRKRR